MTHGADLTSILSTTTVVLENEYVQENEEAKDTTDEESGEIAWDKLMIGNTVLGAGSFGEVREGAVLYKNKMVKVAIKSLKGKLKN